MQTIKAPLAIDNTPALNDLRRVSQTAWPDEAATTPRANVPGPVLAFASRVDRLAELALERLQASPDEDALNAAVANLVQLRALAAGVL